MSDRISASAQANVTESSFFSKVYLWMALGLGISAAGAVWVLGQPALMKLIYTNNWVFFGIVIAELALVMWLSAGLMKMSASMAMSLFCVYSFLNGVTLSFILLVYTGASVAMTFAIAGGTFLFFSVYGATTKRDLTSIGSLCVMGLFGLILASLVNMFLKSEGMYWILTYAGIAIFMGLIAWDTQKLKHLYAVGLTDGELSKKMAIIGALRLYLDFINLFILLLRIFGRRRN